MDKTLLRVALGKFVSGALLIGALIFIPAGTWHFWNGWLFLGVLLIPMFICGLILLVRCPELLRKRLNAREAQQEQRLLVALNGLMFLAGFAAAGLDHRFQWLPVSRMVSITAAAVFLLAYLLYAEVLRENVYLSRTIEIQEHQQVIDTGLYGIVRHPMYSITLILFLSMPLILGSLVSFLIFLIYPVLTVCRIKNEEQVLEEGLEGYADYKKRVRYRLFPLIW